MDERVARIVAAGTRAPSVHNTQPWSVQVEGERRLTLRADPARQLAHCDPQGREMFISCGAFLMNVRVAAAHEGLHASVQLVPDRSDPMLVAHITLGRHGIPEVAGAELFDAVETRRTARGAVGGRPLEPRDIELLRDAAEREHAGVVFFSPTDAAFAPVVSSMRRAEALAARDAASVAEDQAWLGASRSGTDGVPVTAMGAWFRDSVGDPHGSGRDDVSGANAFGGTATSAVLTTVGDGPCNWLVAGQALQRLLLVATTRGIQASFATRVLENPETRDDVERALALESRAQMLLGLRYGAGAPYTPRRDADDVTGSTPGPRADRDDVAVGEGADVLSTP